MFMLILTIANTATGLNDSYVMGHGLTRADCHTMQTDFAINPNPAATFDCVAQTKG